MNLAPKHQNTEKTCPHLGLPSDEQTAMDYPSSQNYCHHVTPYASPGATHQRQFCLAVSFAQCKLFTAKSTKPMPAEYLAEPILIRKETHVLRWLVLGFIILAVIAVTVGLAITRALPAALAHIPTALQPTQNTAAAVSTMTVVTYTPMLAPTLNPSPMLTQTPLVPHLLETPIGSQQQFLLHRVLEGESLNLLATTYQTSIEAIRAVNYNLPGTLWENTVIIIPLNQTDVTGVAPMTAYAISSEEITIQALALEQGVSLVALCALNDLPDNYLFHSGEWALMPIMQLNP